MATLIKTKDFIQLGSINYDDGVLTWDELTKNDEDDVEEIIADTNPDFFIYSSPDSNGNVSIKGLSTGVGGGVEAYQNNDENILNLVIPQKNSDGNNIIKIDNRAFAERDKIKSLVLKQNITQIGSGSFANCTQLTDITLPITIKSTGNSGNAFSDCKSISKVKLTKGLNEDGKGYDYTYSSTITSDYYKNTPWYNAQQNVTIEFEEGITRIGNNTFRDCQKLQIVRFPKSLKTIGSNAFKGCTGMNGELNTIKNITTIEASAFDGCRGITGTLQIPNGIDIISDNAFQGTSITKLVIPKNVTTIGNSTFADCLSLTDLTIPITIRSTGDNGKAFSNCKSISKVKLTKGLNEDGKGYDYTYSSTITSDYYKNTPWYNAQQNVTIEFEEGITRIGNNTFRDCQKLQIVRFPKSLKTIGSNAFKGCTGMNGELNTIKNITTIEASAFDGCRGITGTLQIPNGIDIISDNAFQGTSITKLVIPKNVTTIGNSTFADCLSLTDLTIPITIRSTGDNGKAFSNCKSISKVKLTKGLNEDGKGYDYKTGSSLSAEYYKKTPWFMSTSDSKKIIIEKGITTIGANTFKDVKNATYYYTGTEEEWTSVQGTSGITISSENYNYSE